MPKRISTVSCCLQAKFTLESLSTVKLPHLSRALPMICSTFVSSTTFASSSLPQVFFCLFLFSLFVTKLFSFLCHIGDYKGKDCCIPIQRLTLFFDPLILTTFSKYISLFLCAFEYLRCFLLLIINRYQIIEFPHLLVSVLDKKKLLSSVIRILVSIKLGFRMLIFKTGRRFPLDKPIQHNRLLIWSHTRLN